MMYLKAVLVVASLFFTAITYAQPIDLKIKKNKVIAKIELAGGVETDLELSFENSLGLTKDSIGITAELVDITDPALLSRLPSALTTTPAAFPMMITIEPPASMGLGFNGVTHIDIHTHNLEYTPNTPLRLYKASLGQDFRDITVTTGAGSWRARGHMGDFSQFIVVTDLRTSGTVINAKLNRLQTLLTSYSNQMDTVTATSLSDKYNELANAVSQQDYSQALVHATEFNDIVSSNRGENIPDVWRSSRDITNVAGELMAQVETLSFSLRLAL